jgi:hypothetical protein
LVKILFKNTLLVTKGGKKLSKAKEMFEKIDYVLVEEQENYIRYEYDVKKTISKYVPFVSFFIDKEQIAIGVRVGNWEKQIVDRFDFEIIEPITQQMKELGWIK